MNKKRIILGAGAAVAVMLTSAVLFMPKKKIKVACVGDSITYGATIGNRKANCYPAQLQKILGNSYEVRNFGANGSTVQKHGDRPYIKQKVYERSGKFQPDIVLFMLGTNDSKYFNWKDMKHFMEDYEELVEYYRSLPSQPDVYLMTPSTSYCEGVNEEGFYINNEIVDYIADEVIAYGNKIGLTVIDIHEITANHKEWYPKDPVHPNKVGANAIAREVSSVLSGE